LKRFLSDVQEGIVPQTIWLHQEVGNTQEAKKEVVKLVPDAAEVFSTPKPTRLIQRILQIATNPGDLVLDSFAGSGTTGHAVLQMNAQDGGNRRFILVEMVPDIARNIAAERLRRVIQGRTWTDEHGKEHVEAGLGAGFRFCTLDEPLFDGRGRIRWGIAFGELARHIFFTETGHPLAGLPEAEGPFIGAHEGVSYFLLWNGTTAGVLDAAALRTLAKHENLIPNAALLRQQTSRQVENSDVGSSEVACSEVVAPGVVDYGVPNLFGQSAEQNRKVVYAALCRVSDERLEKAGIVYKQIPYSIRTS
jgi:hypothetical protein